MILTHFVLSLTVIIALFCRQRYYIYAGIVITCLLALFQEVVTPLGMASLIALAVFAYVYYHSTEAPGSLRTLLFLLLATCIGYFILHKVPGFNIYTALNKISVSPTSRPYTMYSNFDKVITALIIYAISYLCVVEKLPDLDALKQTVIILLACIVVIIAPAVISGYVKFDPKIPTILPIWMLNNFLFVAFSEEVLFRGFLQSKLISWFPTRPIFIALAITITSIIFGLFHYRDGTTYMALAGICGLFYGYTYYRTNRILCAMLVHFFLNFTHIMLFTYPSAFHG